MCYSPQRSRSNRVAFGNGAASCSVEEPLAVMLLQTYTLTPPDPPVLWPQVKERYHTWEGRTPQSPLCRIHFIDEALIAFSLMHVTNKRMCKQGKEREERRKLPF